MTIKDCFGQLANMNITYNTSTRRHYLRIDDQKMKECDQCPLFNKCMFLKYNELIKETLKMIDENHDAGSRSRL